MVDSFEVDGLPNLQNTDVIPEELREQHTLMMRSFDNKFRPAFTDFFPMTEAPDGGSRSFIWPVKTSMQPMAQMYDADEPTKYLSAPAIKDERFSSRITKAGFIRKFNEFENDFKAGIISLKYQTMAEDMLASINKRLEWEIGNILYQNINTIRNYSENQDISRGLYADIEGGTFHQPDGTQVTGLDGLLEGNMWDGTSGADVLGDLNELIAVHEDMSDRSFTRAFIGSSTAKNINNDKDITDRIKYVKDTTDGILGMTLMGISFKKVIGNNLKESTQPKDTLGSTEFGSPGQGDLDYDKWGDRNKVPLMTAGGIGAEEWAILGEDVGGRTFNSYVHTLHEDQASTAIEPFVHSYAEQDPFRLKTRAVRSFCPAAEDFASWIVLRNVCTRHG